MRKKEIWMKRGAQVLALGKTGRILSFQENKDIGYVYYMRIKHADRRRGYIYHPDDVQKF